jgi:hypothetical protein
MYKPNVEQNVNPAHDHNPRQHPSSAEDKGCPSGQLELSSKPPGLLYAATSSGPLPSTSAMATCQTSPHVHRSVRHHITTTSYLPTLVQESLHRRLYYIHPARRWPTKGEANNQNHLGNKLAAITVSQFTTLMLPNKKMHQIAIHICLYLLQVKWEYDHKCNKRVAPM